MCTVSSIRDGLPDGARIGIYTDDKHNKTPHFHVYDGFPPENSKKFNLEIAILSLPEIKVLANSNGVMNESLFEALKIWLFKKPRTHFKNLYNWQRLVLAWDSENEFNLMKQHIENCTPLIKAYVLYLGKMDT